MPTGQLSRVEQHEMRKMAEGEMVMFCRVFRPVYQPVPGGGTADTPTLIYEGKCSWRPRPLLASEHVAPQPGLEVSIAWHDFKFPVSAEVGKDPLERIRSDDYIEIPDRQRTFQVVANRGLDPYEIQVLVDATEQPVGGA